MEQLCFAFSSFSGVHSGSEVIVDSCAAGLIPDGGMSYALSALPFHLGEFMALTGIPVRGADLIFCGLAKHWMSPEAIPFMELTAEKQLEVSEADARALLDEHSLPLVGRDGQSLPWTLEEFIPIIKEAFKHDKVTEIKEALRKAGTSRFASASEKTFVDTCLDGIKRASPLAVHATLKLIRDARASRKQASFISGVRKRGDMSARGGALEQCLREEFRMQTRLLELPDAVLGCRAQTLGEAVNPDDWNPQAVLPKDLDDLQMPPTYGEDFSVRPRAEMAFSRHPRLRRYHDEYNEATTADHDREYMRSETERWSETFLADERQRAIDSLLAGTDVGSRWVRVSSHV